MKRDNKDKATELLNAPGPTQLAMRKTAQQLGGNYPVLFSAIEEIGKSTFSAARGINEVGIPIDVANIAPNRQYRPEGFGLSPEGQSLNERSRN